MIDVDGDCHPMESSLVEDVERERGSTALPRHEGGSAAPGVVTSPGFNWKTRLAREHVSQAVSFKLTVTITEMGNN